MFAQCVLASAYCLSFNSTITERKVRRDTEAFLKLPDLALEEKRNEIKAIVTDFLQSADNEESEKEEEVKKVCPTPHKHQTPSSHKFNQQTTGTTTQD